MSGEPLDLSLASGRLHAERHGPADGPLVLCVHGLSANLRGFDQIAPALGAAGLHAVALDLRGRGASEITPPGSYGLASHARDLLDVAHGLGAEWFSVVGWSMGAMVTLVLAELAGERLERAVLLDAAGGRMDETAVAAVRAGLARLDAVVPSPDAYVGAIRAAGAIVPWHEQWEGFYRHELAENHDGTWSARTSRAAAEEDLERSLDHDLEALWDALVMPTLLVRCDAPLGGGLLVPPDTAERFAARVPGATVVSVASNHFGVMTDPATVDAVRTHLSPPGSTSPLS
jgi:pimeloyl-ACP methyl ester carboxylesterase